MIHFDCIPFTVGPIPPQNGKPFSANDPSLPNLLAEFAIPMRVDDGCR